MESEMGTPDESQNDSMEDGIKDIFHWRCKRRDAETQRRKGIQDVKQLADLRWLCFV